MIGNKSFQNSINQNMQTTENSEGHATSDEMAFTSERKRVSLHEDWVVVVLGFLIIGITLFGFILPVPSFGWKTSE